MQRNEINYNWSKVYNGHQNEHASYQTHRRQESVRSTGSSQSREGHNSRMQNRTTFRRNIAEFIGSASMTSKWYIWIGLLFNVVYCGLIILFLTLYGMNDCDKPLGRFLLVYLYQGIISEVLLLPIYYLYERLSNNERRHYHVLTSLERVKLALDIVGLVWFIMGNWWFYTSKTCRYSNPHIYYLTLAIILMGYLFIALSVIVLVFSICRFPERGLKEAATDDMICHLKITIFDSEDSCTLKPYEEQQCVICLSDYEKGEEIRMLPCHHNFHRECVDEWLHANKTCPLCIHSIDSCDPYSNPNNRVPTTTV